MRVTYMGGGGLLEGLLLEVLRGGRPSALLGHHGLGVGPRGDHHGRVGASTRYSAVLHNVLRVVITIDRR